MRHEPLAMSCRGEATWFRDEFWRIVCVATLAIAVVTTAHTIAIALAKCADEGESWKSIKVQRGNGGGEQIEAGAITAGSLTHHRFMPLLHGEPWDHVDHCVSILVGSAVLRLITSAVWAVWPQPTGNGKNLASAA